MDLKVKQVSLPIVFIFGLPFLLWLLFLLFVAGNISAGWGWFVRDFKRFSSVEAVFTMLLGSVVWIGAIIFFIHTHT